MPSKTKVVVQPRRSMFLNHKGQLATLLLCVAAWLGGQRKVAHGAVTRQLLIDCLRRGNFLCFFTGHNSQPASQDRFLFFAEGCQLATWSPTIVYSSRCHFLRKQCPISFRLTREPPV